MDAVGEWCGTWQAAGTEGPVTLSLTQDGPDVSGTGNIEDTPCGAFRDLTVVATVTGDTITGELSSGGTSATFEAQIDADSMDGSFEITQSSTPCEGAAGTFAATRQESCVPECASPPDTCTCTCDCAGTCTIDEFTCSVEENRSCTSDCDNVCIVYCLANCGVIGSGVTGEGCCS